MESYEENAPAGTTVDEIIANVETRMHMMLNEAQLVKNEELERVVDEHYADAIRDIVFQISSIPANREEAGLSPMVTPEEINGGYREILGILINAFGYKQKKIEDDIKIYLRQYTPDDIREIHRLKKANLLN